MSDFEMIFGTTPGVFIGITLIRGGGCALMTGRALALNWRPEWQLIVYALLLTMADRFLVYALFQGELLSLSAYLADAAILIAIAFVTFRITRARQMVRQYPWDYRRHLLFFHRPK
jgi:hypothetical protein